MSQQELLKKVVESLNENNIEYMITGSIVSSMQGEPRLTHDIDIVISLDDTGIKKLLEAFPLPDFYLSKQGIKRAISNNSMFNLINVNQGDKVDFWMLTDTVFDHSRFKRKKLEKVMGKEMYISTPEDTILAKLKWLKQSQGSEKQFTDILRVYEIQYHDLDIDYIEYWVKELDVEDYWQKVKQEAEVL